jgi:hypothetical protein
MVDPDGTLTATIDPPEGGLIEDLEYFVTRNDGEPWPDERRIVVDASALPTTACSTPSTETTPQTAAGSGG